MQIAHQLWHEEHPDDHGHQEGGAEELGEQAARQGRCLNVGHTRMLTQPQWLSQT